jgi:hypothetical protein
VALDAGAATITLTGGRFVRGGASPFASK